ncbi:MAG: hypothetical protein Q8920_04525 [Bacillota bacterium]|nr:hypothetical protein [Bacillota bacterium]
MQDDVQANENSNDQETAEEAIKLEYELEYVIKNDSGNEIESGFAKSIVGCKAILLTPLGLPPMKIPFSDLRKISSGNWTIELTLSDNNVILFRKLGRLYDSFLDEINDAYGKVTRKVLLMEEKLLSQFNQAFIRKIAKENLFDGEGTIFIQETGLVIALKSGETQRIPYAFIEKLEDHQWSFLLVMKSRDEFVLERLGRETDFFRSEIYKAISSLENNALEFTMSLAPSVSPIKLRPFAKKLLDGLAVVKKDTIGVPELWNALETRLATAGLKDSFNYLSSVSNPENFRIGIKRGLWGSLDKEYIWLFVPVLRGSKNYIVMEASSSGSGGRATYIFDASGEETEKIMDELNFCLYMINFRREPIYLTEEQLQKPENEHYRLAIERISGLKKLREKYLTRVFHKSAEQWQRDIDVILQH